MYLFVLCLITIMARFDDNNFSLSGLMQEGQELNINAISESDENNNYGGLLDCAKQLAGQGISKLKKQSITSTSEQGAVELSVEYVGR